MRHLIFLLIVSFFCCQSSTKSGKQIHTNSSLVILMDSVVHNDSIKYIKKTSSPIYLLDSTLGNDEQIPFQSFAMTHANVQLIPNKHFRDKWNIHQLKNITGVTHFFLDHDLTSGFVHEYTQNFFNRLSADDFVMKFEANETNKMMGEIRYIKKGDVKPDDKLGKNIAYFRQWKLSEIDWKQNGNGIIINVSKANFSWRYYCPKAKPIKDISVLTQIPILVEADEEGYNSIEKMDRLNMQLGGTVVFIWEDSITHKIYFQDMHSSWKEILQHAILIAKQFHVNPTLAIGDAGPYSPKILAKKNHEMNTSLIDDLWSNSEWFGAGFGYIPQQINLLKLKVNNDSSLIFAAPQR